MVDKKLSEFSQITPDEIEKLICLYLDENNAIKNGVVDFATLNNLIVHKSGTEEITGDKTFSGDAVFEETTTFNNPINGTCSRATADASGNNIASTYATKTELDQKSSFKLFHHDWFDYQLNDMDWLRADTFSWQAGTVYSNAYEHLVADITGKTLKSETIGAITIQYYLADDGHKIAPASEESNVASLFTTTGVAWYYILDTANQRFKLPRTKYGFVGLRDGVGKYVPESLPNIKAGVYIDGSNLREESGAFSISGSNTAYTSSYGTKNKLDFNAHNSNSTYQDNAPVQQRATQMYLYFYVGQFSQTATEQTAGLNSELFNGKADIEALNNKIKLVSTLPATPTNGVLYVIS